MTLLQALHPGDNVDRQNVPRKAERRLAGIEDSVDASMQRLEDYIEKCEGILITATRNNADDTRVSWTEITRKQKWEEKQLYGRFKWLTNDISHEKENNVELAKKEKPQERNRISSNRSKKQRHKDQPYHNKNR